MRTFLRRLLIAVGVLAALVVGGIVYVRSSLPEAPDLGAGSESHEELVARGRYLFENVSVCADCHSQRDFGKFAGPIVEGTTAGGGARFGHGEGVPGTVYSRNITPAGVGDWTDAELARAIFSGVSRDGKPLFPIMPYPNYARMCGSDARAILAYVRTLAPIENEVPERELDFPMSAIVWTIPGEAELGACPDRRNEVAYGEYLVRIASCGDCHTRMEKGEPVRGMEFAGGFAMALPNGGVVRTSNITPDQETGIGRWTADEFVARFRTMAGHSNDPADPSGYNTLMPWRYYGAMAEEDLRAMYAYLRTVPAVRSRVERFTPPPAGGGLAAR